MTRILKKKTEEGGSGWEGAAGWVGEGGLGGGSSVGGGMGVEDNGRIDRKD